MEYYWECLLINGKSQYKHQSFVGTLLSTSGSFDDYVEMSSYDELIDEIEDGS